LTGIGIRGFVRLRRTSEAALEFRDTGMQKSETDVGNKLSSQTVSSRVFKRSCGITPKAYRKSRISIPPLLKRVLLISRVFQDSSDKRLQNYWRAFRALADSLTFEGCTILSRSSRYKL